MEHHRHAAIEDRGRWHRSAQEADWSNGFQPKNESPDGKTRGLNGVISPEMEVQLTSD